jgi:hypothetical protein
MQTMRPRNEKQQMQSMRPREASRSAAVESLQHTTGQKNTYILSDFNTWLGMDEYHPGMHAFT